MAHHVTREKDSDESDIAELVRSGAPAHRIWTLIADSGFITPLETVAVDFVRHRKGRDDREFAEELFGQVLTALTLRFNHNGRFPWEARGCLRSWLWVVVEAECRNAWRSNVRKKRRDEDQSELIMEVEAERRAKAQEQMTRVVEGILGLRDPCSKLLYMLLIEQHDQKKAAKDFDKSETWVHNHARQCLEELRTDLRKN